MRLVHQIRESWEVPRDIVLRRYPPFVTGGPLPRGDVPVPWVERPVATDDGAAHDPERLAVALADLG